MVTAIKINFSWPLFGHGKSPLLCASLSGFHCFVHEGNPLCIWGLFSFSGRYLCTSLSCKDLFQVLLQWTNCVQYCLSPDFFLGTVYQMIKHSTLVEFLSGRDLIRLNTRLFPITAREGVCVPNLMVQVHDWCFWTLSKWSIINQWQNHTRC